MFVPVIIDDRPARSSNKSAAPTEPSKVVETVSMAPPKPRAPSASRGPKKLTTKMIVDAMRSNTFGVLAAQYADHPGIKLAMKPTPKAVFDSDSEGEGKLSSAPPANMNEATFVSPPQKSVTQSRPVQFEDDRAQFVIQMPFSTRIYW